MIHPNQGFFCTFNNQKVEMTRERVRILLIFILLSMKLNAQDIHWSQFNDNQLFQNPGNAGNFKGDYRIIANYRSQWRSVTVPFNTLSFSGDMRIEKFKNVGLGVLFFNDAAGDGKFRTNEVQLNGAYIYKITADSNHTIRPGINIGINHRQVDWDQFSFDNQYNGMMYDPTLPSNETYQNQRNTNLSVGTGIVYEYRITERKKSTTGLSLFNLNKPDQGFFGKKVRRDIRISFFAKGMYQLTDKVDLMPSLSLQFQGKYKEIVLGSNVKHTLINQPTDYKAVYFGAWFRNQDAGYLSAGMDYQNWFLGMSYDFNFSKLIQVSNGRGGIEFAARYIIKRFKPKKISHRVCPDFI